LLIGYLSVKLAFKTGVNILSKLRLTQILRANTINMSYQIYYWYYMFNGAQ